MGQKYARYISTSTSTGPRRPPEVGIADGSSEPAKIGSADTLGFHSIQLPELEVGLDRMKLFTLSLSPFLALTSLLPPLHSSSDPSPPSLHLMPADPLARTPLPPFGTVSIHRPRQITRHQVSSLLSPSASPSPSSSSMNLMITFIERRVPGSAVDPTQTNRQPSSQAPK